MRWMAALTWRLPPRSRRWRLVRPELTGIGARPAARASLASVAKRSAPAISPTSLAAVSGPNPGSAEQLRRDPGDELGDLGLERFDRLGQLAQAAQLVAGDPDAHRLLGPGQAPADPAAPLAREQRAARQHELGPEVVQVPLQRVVEPDPLTDQALAVIDQQPQVELRAGQRRRRQRLEALGAAPPGRRRSRRCCRTCRARGPSAATPAINRVETRTTRSPRPIRNRSSAPETCRQSSSAHTRSPARPRAQITSAPNPRAPTATVFSPISWPVAASTAAIVCELLWVSAPSTIINPSPFTSTESGHPADTACWGRCHAPIKSRRASPTGDERHNKRKSGHPGRQPQRESARRPVGTISTASDVTDSPNRNSKPQSGSAVSRRPGCPAGAPCVRQRQRAPCTPTESIVEPSV